MTHDSGSSVPLDDFASTNVLHVSHAIPNNSQPARSQVGIMANSPDMVGMMSTVMTGDLHQPVSDTKRHRSMTPSLLSAGRTNRSASGLVELRFQPYTIPGPSGPLSLPFRQSPYQRAASLDPSVSHETRRGFDPILNGSLASNDTGATPTEEHRQDDFRQREISGHLAAQGIYFDARQSTHPNAQVAAPLLQGSAADQAVGQYDSWKDVSQQ
jgi:hypothetical protein